MGCSICLTPRDNQTQDSKLKWQKWWPLLATFIKPTACSDFSEGHRAFVFHGDSDHQCRVFSEIVVGMKTGSLLSKQSQSCVFEVKTLAALCLSSHCLWLSGILWLCPAQESALRTQSPVGLCHVYHYLTGVGLCQVQPLIVSFSFLIPFPPP